MDTNKATPYLETNKATQYLLGSLVVDWKSFQTQSISGRSEFIKNKEQQ